MVRGHRLSGAAQKSFYRRAARLALGGPDC